MEELADSQKMISNTDLVQIFKQTNGIADRTENTVKQATVDKQLKNEFSNQMMAFFLSFKNENAVEEGEYLTINFKVLMKDPKFAQMIKDFCDEYDLNLDENKFVVDIVHYLREQGFCDIANYKESEDFDVEIKFMHKNVEKCILDVVKAESTESGVKLFTFVNKVRNSVSLFFNKNFIKNYLNFLCSSNQITEIFEGTYALSEDGLYY